MDLFIVCVVLFAIYICLGNCQLVVNVRNNGGDIYRETIEANTTLDSISLNFRKSDGTLITQFIDGRNVNTINFLLTEFTEGHQYRRTDGSDGLVSTGLMPYKAHSPKCTVLLRR